MSRSQKKKGTWLEGQVPLKAGEGARTLDIQLGRLTLYQLSYTRKCLLIVQQGSNLTGHQGFVCLRRGSLATFERLETGHWSTETPSVS